MKHISAIIVLPTATFLTAAPFWSPQETTEKGHVTRHIRGGHGAIVSVSMRSIGTTLNWNWLGYTITVSHYTTICNRWPYAVQKSQKSMVPRRPVEWLQNDWKLSHHGIRTENLLHKAPLCPNRSLPFCTQPGLLEAHGFIESDRFVTPQCDHSEDLIDQPTTVVPRMVAGHNRSIIQDQLLLVWKCVIFKSSRVSPCHQWTTFQPCIKCAMPPCPQSDAHSWAGTVGLRMSCASLSWQQEFSWVMG